MTVRDIQDHLNWMYANADLQCEKQAHAHDQEWQNRPLERVYAAVFLDAIHYKVRQEGAITRLLIWSSALIWTGASPGHVDWGARNLEVLACRTQ